MYKIITILAVALMLTSCGYCSVLGVGSKCNEDTVMTRNQSLIVPPILDLPTPALVQKRSSKGEAIR